jgi:hypothetical protein
LQSEHLILRKQLKALQKEIDNAELLNQNEVEAALIERRGRLALRIRSLRLYCHSRGYDIYINDELI